MLLKRLTRSCSGVMHPPVFMQVAILSSTRLKQPKKAAHDRTYLCMQGLDASGQSKQVSSERHSHRAWGPISPSELIKAPERQRSP